MQWVGLQPSNWHHNGVCGCPILVLLLAAAVKVHFCPLSDSSHSPRQTLPLLWLIHLKMCLFAYYCTSWHSFLLVFKVTCKPAVLIMGVNVFAQRFFFLFPIQTRVLLWHTAVLCPGKISRYFPWTKCLIGMQQTDYCATNYGESSHRQIKGTLSMLICFCHLLSQNDQAHFRMRTTAW